MSVKSQIPTNQTNESREHLPSCERRLTNVVLPIHGVSWSRSEVGSFQMLFLIRKKMRHLRDIFTKQHCDSGQKPNG